jgi:hypothetical protein
MTDVSEELTASIIRVLIRPVQPTPIFATAFLRGLFITLMMEAVSSSETSASIYKIKRATSEKTAIFILVTVRTSYLTKFVYFKIYLYTKF